MSAACLRQTFTNAGGYVSPAATTTLLQARRRHVCGICELGLTTEDGLGETFHPQKMWQLITDLTFFNDIFNEM